jgi:hypothetical protein
MVRSLFPHGFPMLQSHLKKHLYFSHSLNLSRDSPPRAPKAIYQYKLHPRAQVSLFNNSRSAASAFPFAQLFSKCFVSRLDLVSPVAKISMRTSHDPCFNCPRNKSAFWRRTYTVPASGFVRSRDRQIPETPYRYSGNGDLSRRSYCI